jgi:hypothetical protein
MASTEEKLEQLVAQFGELESKYKESRDKVKELEERESGDRPVVVSREKKPKKFSGLEGNVSDWILDMKSFLGSRPFKSCEKVEHVLDSLEHPAKTEVKLQLDIRNTTVDKLFDVLKKTFGVRESPVELERKFFDRNQKPNESLNEYSYALIELLFPLQEFHIRFKDDQDKYLNEKLADGVRNVNLKRELKRINLENPTIKFWELRSRGLRWLEDEPTTKQGTHCNEMQSNVKSKDPVQTSLDEIIKLQKQQQEQLQTLSKELFQLKQKQKPYSQRYESKSKQWKNNESQKDSSGIFCYYCKEPNHMIRDCLKLKNKNSRTAGKQYAQSKEQSVNLDAPVSRAKPWEHINVAQQTEDSS